ncbi:RNA polymerase sigma-70 factor [Naumannella huperziae]
MHRAEEFEALRPLLFSIAYRILGSVAEAEDAVQETWLRYAAVGTVPRSPKAYLCTAVTRVSINVLGSARVRREEYVGEWLPEPLLDDPYADPQRSAELADSVSMAALRLLEHLSPPERAVFVLREVFDFAFSDIAVTLERSEAACRQLAVRARRHMESGGPRFEADGRDRDELAARFFAAFTDGDVDALRALLARDVRIAGDSGGNAPALVRPVTGAEQVARVLGSVGPVLAQIGISHERHPINGQPGAIARDSGGRVVYALVLDVAGDQISTILAVSNPDKLGHLGRVGDAWAIRADFQRARRTAR